MCSWAKISKVIDIDFDHSTGCHGYHLSAGKSFKKQKIGELYQSCSHNEEINIRMNGIYKVVKIYAIPSRFCVYYVAAMHWYTWIAIPASKIQNFVIDLLISPTSILYSGFIPRAFRLNIPI